MAKVTGIGGVFLRSADGEGLRAMLSETMNLELEPWGRAFPWRERDDPEKKGATVLGLFEADSTYFEPSPLPFMINLRVDDLDGMVAQLEAAGHAILHRADEPNGRFAHVMAPGGLKLELWEPVADDPYDP